MSRRRLHNAPIVTQNCWSAYGAGLPAVRVTTLSAVDTGGEKWLRAGTKGRGVWQAELASTALETRLRPATMAPATLIFASQAVGTTSGAESLTIQNTGAIALTLGAPTVSSSDFVLNNQCPGEPGGGGLLRDLDRVCADGDGTAQRDGDADGECAGRCSDRQCAGRGHPGKHDRADAAAAGFRLGAHRADQPGAIHHCREYRPAARGIEAA